MQIQSNRTQINGEGERGDTVSKSDLSVGVELVQGWRLVAGQILLQHGLGHEVSGQHLERKDTGTISISSLLEFQRKKQDQGII